MTSQAEQNQIARNLHDNLVAYWHDVDFNWGVNAGAHYTVFSTLKMAYWAWPSRAVAI